MVATLGRSFAPQRGLRCCTKSQVVFGSYRFSLTFYLQIPEKYRWAMLGSNQRPLPCEGSVIVCRRVREFAKCLQILVLGLWRISQLFRRFTRVAARTRANTSFLCGRQPTTCTPVKRTSCQCASSVLVTGSVYGRVFRINLALPCCLPNLPSCLFSASSIKLSSNA
jgi:hypothetical protein